MKTLIKLSLVSMLALAASAASAITYTYVGSWIPDDSRAPVWDGSPPNGPLAYTGQEAAAFLFGGPASSYAISTIDSNVANINFSAVYDVIGYGGATFADNYSSKYLGLYYGPTSGYTGALNGAASTFVRDNGISGTNYAFRISGAVPEPASWMLMIGGFGLVGASMRRKAAVVQA